MAHSVLSSFLSLSHCPPRVASSIACGCMGTSYWRMGRGAGRFPARHAALPLQFRCCSSNAESEGAAQRRKRVVSGVQPTGLVHLGNYLGAIKNWTLLQNTYETLFFIVDLHAITLPYEAPQLSKATRETAAIYLACGVDISKASVFVQSHVPAHVELMWLLCSVTPIGWLNRMIQFKEKSRKAGDENVGAALLTYPILMASDILLYQADLVPVGEDQKQHLELTCELAQRVNNLFGGRKWKKMGGRGGMLFKVPEALIPPDGARVMSLTDGLSKMSKSAPSDQSRINLLDPKDELNWVYIGKDMDFFGNDKKSIDLFRLQTVVEAQRWIPHFLLEKVIVSKIKRCKTDSFSGLEFDNPERPECNNLLTVYHLVTGRTKEEIAKECQNMNWGVFKSVLTDALIDHLSPIQARYEEITSDATFLDKVLQDGASKAADIADATLNNVKEAMGFLRR